MKIINCERQYIIYGNQDDLLIQIVQDFWDEKRSERRSMNFPPNQLRPFLITYTNN